MSGYALIRRHSWISPRFNAQIPCSPSVLGPWRRVLRAECPKRFWGRAPAHAKVRERPKYPALGADPSLSLLASCVYPHRGPETVRAPTTNILERAAQKQQLAKRTDEGRRMRYTPSPVPDSRLLCLAPRARRTGGIRDGVCVCIPHISSRLPLFSPLFHRHYPLETFTERVGRKDRPLSPILSLIV